MMFSIKAPEKVRRETRAETVEGFLTRGGRIERIEAHPNPEGRVLLRGQGEHQRQFGFALLPCHKNTG